MEISFEPLSAEHRKDVMNIFNYYVENSYSAYPETILPLEFFDRFLEMTQGYPAYVIKMKGDTVGFCFLRPYNPFPTFKACAEITYFLDPAYTGKGIGNIALEKLEREAKKQEIRILLASVASENPESLAFHRKNGFTECGRFERIIKKRGIEFDIVWFQKFLP